MNEPIFVLGCERSGTTLLRIILNQNQALHIPGESWFLKQLSIHQDSYGDFTKPHQRFFFIRDLQLNKATSETYSFDVFQLSLDEAEQVLEKASPTNYAGAASALFQASADKQGKPRWADKTPRHVLHLSWLAEAFPNAKFVHVIRDARDVSLSLVKAGWVKNTTDAAKRWKDRVEAGLSMGRKLGQNRYYELQYEELVTHPEKTLQNLCRWLELEYSENMMQHHNSASNHIDRDWHLHAMVAKPLNTSRVYAWKNKLTRHQIAEIENITGDLLNKLGYELADNKVFRLANRLYLYFCKTKLQIRHTLLHS